MAEYPELSITIHPIASESLGVRSMATWVRTPDVRILIDPGVALAPHRSGLPPHQREIEALEFAWRKIREYAGESDLVIITHYHYDHFNPDQVDILARKTLLLKDPTRTNRSQRIRAQVFLDRLRAFHAEWTWADGKILRMGETTLCFSEPTPHGPGSRLGTVIQVAITFRKQTFVFTSDIQGPFREDQNQFILSQMPRWVYLDGPPLYLLGQHYPHWAFENVLQNLQELLSLNALERLILDHHPLRTPDWRIYFQDLPGFHRVQSAASFLGQPETLLEAHRRDLYSAENTM